MDKKYYVPEIEEFHVGFEYEGRYKKDLPWVKLIHNVWDDAYPDYDSTAKVSWDIEANNIRVKYLNKEDVESLGFKTKLKKSWIYAQLREEDIYLDFNIENIFCKISNLEEILFQGKIKNISELKKLLKQLNIK